LYHAAKLSFHLGKSLIFSQQWLNLNGYFFISLNYSKAWETYAIAENSLVMHTPLHT
jgi:hypothetical protein